MRIHTGPRAQMQLSGSSLQPTHPPPKYRKGMTRKKVYSIRTDELKVCPSCRRVYEIIDGVTVYRDGFPRYGKDEVRCEGCEKCQ